MLEAAVAAALAAIGGVAALTNRVHARISRLRDQYHTELSDLERRVDVFELRVAEKYVSKADLNATLKSMEDHMIRIEKKLDKIIFPKK